MISLNGLSFASARPTLQPYVSVLIVQGIQERVEKRRRRRGEERRGGGAMRKEGGRGKEGGGKKGERDAPEQNAWH